MDMKYWWRQVLDVLFPRGCASCGNPLLEPCSLCIDCLSKIRITPSPHCLCCGAPFPVLSGKNHLCGECLRKPPPFSIARSAVFYESPVNSLLHRLKYHADRTVLPAFSEILSCSDMKKEFSSCDLVVPVPLYRKRLQKRGLNQSLLLAHIFFQEKEKNIDPNILIRTKDTRSQTGLSGKERRQNLRGAFAVAGKDLLRDRRVCLVDDVYTTGTTVRECARTLLREGVAEVMVATMARVVDRGVLGGPDPMETGR